MLTTVLVALPSQVPSLGAGLAGGEGTAICWALWKDERRAQSRDGHVDKTWLEATLSPVTQAEG